MVRVNWQEKAAQGCSFLSDPECWEKTALMPISETSTSTMDCCEGSGCIRMGTEVKCLFSSVKALSVSGVELKGLAGEVNCIKGDHLTIVPDEPALNKPQEPM